MQNLIRQEFTSVYFLATMNMLVPGNVKFILSIMDRERGSKGRKQ